MFDEKDIGKLSCLWEAIHTFANYDRDSVVNKEMFNMVLINEILGHRTHREIGRASCEYGA